MMYTISTFILGLQVLVFLGVFVALFYLIFRRIERKKQETFEKRDN